MASRRTLSPPAPTHPARCCTGHLHPGKRAGLLPSYSPKRRPAIYLVRESMASSPVRPAHRGPAVRPPQAGPQPSSPSPRLGPLLKPRRRWWPVRVPTLAPQGARLITDSTTLPSTTQQAPGRPLAAAAQWLPEAMSPIGVQPSRARQPQPPRAPQVKLDKLHPGPRTGSPPGPEPKSSRTYAGTAKPPCHQRAPAAPRPAPPLPRAQKKARACYSLSTLDACTSGLFFASRCRSIFL